MSLRFIHTADIHLGAKFLSLGGKADIQREKLKKAFSKIVDTAVENAADFILIAGDLFDNANPSETSINFVKDQFRKLQQNNVWIIVIPGTHDRLADGSVFKVNDFSSTGNKIHIFDNPEKTFHKIDELETVFYANPNLHNKSHQSPLRNFSQLPNVKYHIAMAHGSYQITGKSNEDDYPITEKEILNSKMDYTALGHWHGFLNVSQGGVNAYYSGAPELIALDQKNSGCALLVKLEDNKCEIEKIQIGETSLAEIAIDLSKINSLNDLITRIRENKNPELVQKVTLTGFRPESLIFETTDLLEELRGEFFHLIIEDNSITDLESIDNDENPQDFILGKFIRKVQDSDLSENQKNEVLKYGAALLKGRNIL